MIDTTNYDKALKEFIDNLSKIKLTFKLSKNEELLMQDAGLTSILYTLCFIKSAMNASDEEIINSLALSKSFYKKLTSLIKDELILFDKLNFEYQKYLTKVNSRFTKNRQQELIFKYFEKGQQYIRDNYLPGNNIEENRGGSISLQKIEKELKKSKAKIKKILKKEKELIEQISETNDEQISMMLDLSNNAISEYFKITEITEFLLKKQVVHVSFLANALAFIEHKGLISDFYEFSNKQEENTSNIISMEDIKKNREKDK